MKKVILFTCIIIGSSFLETFLHMTKEYQRLEKAAYHYAKKQHFSKAKIYELLTSPNVHGFSKELSKKILHDLAIDYKKSALIQGQHFSDDLFYSEKRIYDELTSPEKENFSAEEAQYALQHIFANYQENALHQVYFYLDEGYSLDKIKEHLEDPQKGGFTKEEVLYALNNY